MTFQDFLLHLFYLVDSELAALKAGLGAPLRRRGPAPVLDDSEVLTIEMAGEFLGIDTDKGIYRFFRRYHRGEFPALGRVCRTTFARQSANLWRVRQLLHGRVLRLLPLADPVDGQVLWVVDSFPLRVCKVKRAPGSKLFKGWAGYGHDPTQGRDSFFGFRVHLRCGDRGPVARVELAAGGVTDLAVAGELAPLPPGTGLGDRNYWGPDWARGLLRCGLELLAPFKKKSSDPDKAGSAVITRIRQVIEPVIGQLATRFHAERTWARDLWHLCSRLTRKVLSHTAAVLLNWRAGNPMLQLDLLVQD